MWNKNSSDKVLFHFVSLGHISTSVMEHLTINGSFHGKQEIRDSQENLKIRKLHWKIL